MIRGYPFRTAAQLLASLTTATPRICNFLEVCSSCSRVSHSRRSSVPFGFLCGKPSITQLRSIDLQQPAGLCIFLHSPAAMPPLSLSSSSASFPFSSDRSLDHSYSPRTSTTLFALRSLPFTLLSPSSLSNFFPGFHRRRIGFTPPFASSFHSPIRSSLLSAPDVPRPVSFCPRAMPYPSTPARATLIHLLCLAPMFLRLSKSLFPRSVLQRNIPARRARNRGSSISVLRHLAKL